VLVGLVVGAVAFSGALLALVRKGDEPDPANRWVHTWPAEVSGEVWFTVDAEDAGNRSVTIRWGPWVRPITHASADPVTYVFTKELTPEGESPVPITVDVAPGADVVFGDGPPPSPFEDVNADWVPANS
jgi:hypothetical protein